MAVDPWKWHSRFVCRLCLYYLLASHAHIALIWVLLKWTFAFDWLGLNKSCLALDIQHGQLIIVRTLSVDDNKCQGNTQSTLEWMPKIPIIIHGQDSSDHRKCHQCSIKLGIWIRFGIHGRLCPTECLQFSHETKCVITIDVKIVENWFANRLTIITR